MKISVLVAAVALLAALVSSAGTTSFPPVRKKFIAHGWDMLAVTPEEVLAHAAEFDKTGIDGVTLMINDKLADGRRISHSRIMNDPPWPRDLLKDKIATFREIVKHPSLTESFISSWWAPRKRLSWEDDAAWANLATNMGTVAWLAKEGGLRGILVDAEDYPKTKQYDWQPGDPAYDDAAALARRRGAEVFSAIFREYPDITFLSFWMLSLHDVYFRSADPLAVAKAAGDLWPWFVNGMLDVMPPTARFVDGNEHAYRYEAEKGDFYRSACEQRVAALSLIAPENRAKYRAHQLAGFGLYLDSYVVPTNSTWYMGPLDGSRLNHFVRNLEQAAAAADEYVWVYGEKHAWIPWKGTKNPRFTKTGTWDEVLPGLNDEMLGVKDMRVHLHRRMDVLRAAGVLTNVVCDIQKWGRWQDEKLLQGRMEKDANGVALEGCGRGCHIAYVANVKPGARYGIQFRMKGEGSSTVYWQRDRRWDWKLPGTPAVFGEPDAEGWRLGEALVRVPQGSNRLALQLGAHQRAGERVVFRDVAVYRLNP